MTSLLWIAAGGAIGASLRTLVARLFTFTLGEGVPLAIFFINLLGCFLMGVLTEAFALKWQPGEHWQSFLTTGLLGGFTTLSAFSFEFVLLREQGFWGWALLYAVASVAGAILLFYGGSRFMRFLFIP